MLRSQDQNFPRNILAKLLAMLAAISLTFSCCHPAMAAGGASSWGVLSVDRDSSQLVVTLPDSRVNNDVYSSLIIDKLCPSVRSGEFSLQGIREILVLNRFVAQGYVFEGGASGCQNLGGMSAQDAELELLGQTHMHYAH